jgi:hypothetical protein
VLTSLGVCIYMCLHHWVYVSTCVYITECMYLRVFTSPSACIYVCLHHWVYVTPFGADKERIVEQCYHILCPFFPTCGLCGVPREVRWGGTSPSRGIHCSQLHPNHKPPQVTMACLPGIRPPCTCSVDYSCVCKLFTHLQPGGIEDCSPVK